MEIPDGLTNDVEVALSVVDQLPILVAGVEGPDLVVQLANAATRATVGGANFLGSRSSDDPAQFLAVSLYRA